MQEANESQTKRNCRGKVQKRRIWRGRALSSIVITAAAACGSAHASDRSGGNSGITSGGANYPHGTITLLVGYGAGSATDLLARSFAQALQTERHWNVVVEDEAGASGALALSSMISKGDPDTLLFTTSSLPFLVAQNESKYGLAMFKAAGTVATQPVALASGKYLSLSAAVKAAKQHPDSLTIGIPGLVDINTDAIFTLARKSGIRLRWVPYKGGAAITAALLGGQIDLGTVGPSNFIPSVKSGKLHVLGLSGSSTLPELPTVQTFSKQGYSVPQTNVYGVYASKDTSAADVRTISLAIKAVLAKSIAFRNYLNSSGLSPHYLGPSATTQYLAQSVAGAVQDVPSLMKLVTEE